MADIQAPPEGGMDQVLMDQEMEESANISHKESDQKGVGRKRPALGAYAAGILMLCTACAAGCPTDGNSNGWLWSWPAPWSIRMLTDRAAATLRLRERPKTRLEQVPFWSILKAICSCHGLAAV